MRHMVLPVALVVQRFHARWPDPCRQSKVETFEPKNEEENLSECPFVDLS